MDHYWTVPWVNRGRCVSFFSTLVLVIAMANGSSVYAQSLSPFAVNSVTDTIYLINTSTANSVTVINGSTDATTATVSVGANPAGIAVNSVTNKIYVTNENAVPGVVTVIDGATNATTSVSVGANPVGVAVNPVTNKIYVANYGDNTVSVIDGATHATATVPVGKGPYFVAVNTVTNKVYVGNFQDGTVSVIDGATNTTASVKVASFTQDIQAIAVNSVTNTIYVADSLDKAVVVINGATNATSTVNVGAFPQRIAVNSATNTIYVDNYGGNTVTVINGATNATATVQAGSAPNDIALDSATNTVYVADSLTETVTVIDGATNATSTIPDTGLPFEIAVNSATNKVYVYNQEGSVATFAGTGSNPAPTPTPTPPAGGGGGSSGTARLINISTRAQVGTGGNILIPGFVIGGSGTETLLIRGDGPSLIGFGVSGALATPSLKLFDSTGKVLAANTGWGTNPNPAQIVSTAASVGAFAFASGSADCALIASLPAGAYTVQVSGVNNTTGVALAEVYEVAASGTRLINISTRAQVGTGGNIIIAGFVITGSGQDQLLVRGDGPALTPFGVSGVLAQPSLSIFNNSGVSIASNVGWTTNSNPALITSTAALVGAFAFPSVSNDSAEIINLTAGAYTVQVSGVNNSTGVALAEVYEVPAK